MRRTGLLLVLIGAAAAAGCQTGRATGELLVSAGARVVDVPVPVHFARSDHRSFDHIGPSEIIVHHVYHAFNVSRTSVTAFYRKQMPVAGWRPIGELEVSGRRLMAFDRGDEKCLIHIKKKFFLLTIIKIEVVGRPSGST